MKTNPAPTCATRQKETKSKPQKINGGTKLLKKDLASLEKKLQKLEEVLAVLGQEKEENAHDYQALENIMAQEATAMQDYEALYAAWESLSERLEQAEGNDA